MKNYLKSYKAIIALVLLMLTIGSITYKKIAYASPGHGESAGSEESAISPAFGVGVETVTNSNVESLGATSLSWTGEVLSTTDVQIYGAREGQIAEWRVRLGDMVKKGEILGRLTAPPATIELSVALAERSGALIRAQAEAAATEKLVQEERNRLAVLQAALTQSQDAGFLVAEKEAIRSVETSKGAAQELLSTEKNRIAAIEAATAGLAEAEALIPLRKQAARSAIEKQVTNLASRLNFLGLVPSPSQVHSFTIHSSYGSYTTNSEYVTNLRILVQALAKPDYIPHVEVLRYSQSARELLATTIAAQFSESHLADLREIASDDEQTVLEALTEVKSAEANVVVKRAELEKITAENDRDVTTATTNVLNARSIVDSAEAIKQKSLADTRIEFAKQKSELDMKISERNRELASIYAQVRAAEAAYAVISSGAGGQNIVAPQDGVVSALFKNVGDHVTPDTAIGGISSNNLETRFVRFRIPSDARIPAVGEEVKIERPGFPLTQIKAKVIGVGLALDQNGSYAADAEFIESADWPVHASVRVVGKQLGQVILAPLSAVWWNEKGVSQVWLVMENNVIRPQEVKVGRAIGDRIEVEEGLNVGDRFVTKPNDDLKTGQSITDLSAKALEVQAKQIEPEGDGHGHSHE